MSMVEIAICEKVDVVILWPDRIVYILIFLFMACVLCIRDSRQVPIGFRVGVLSPPFIFHFFSHCVAFTMGKAKQRRKNKQKASNEASTPSSRSSIVQRIRYGDDGTRLAALTALFQNPASIRTEKCDPSLSLSILTAVRDQYINASNPDISLVSAQILQQAISLGASTDELTISWLTVIMEKRQKTKEISDSSLELLATLVEENSLVTSKLVQQDSMRFNLFQMLREEMPRTARIWHSLLQENDHLWEAISAPDQNSIIEMLGQYCLNSLHCIGALMGGPFIVSDKSADQCIATLQDFAKRSRIPNERLRELSAAHEKYLQEKSDAKLDSEIISNQNEKKESARLIARRLKATHTEDEMERQLDLVDYEENWYTMMGHFERDVIEPIDLALEVIAALFLSEKYQPQIVKFQLADTCWTFLGDLLIISRNEELANPVVDVLGMTLEKVTSCLANASHRNMWSVPRSIWGDLEKAYEMTRSSVARESLIFLFTSVVDSNKDSRKWIGQETMRWLLHILGGDNVVLCRNVVSVLGNLLTTEDHTAEVNETICRSILECGRKHSMHLEICGEVLNALMDVYGDDNRHSDVFDRCQVLAYFQEMLPVLNRLLFATNDNEEWEEVAYNAQRFLQYKKMATA